MEHCLCRFHCGGAGGGGDVAGYSGVEPSELIGTGVTSDEQLISASTRAVKEINPEIQVLQGAGISNADDVYRTIFAGADATGSSSAICKAADPAKMLREMLAAARQAYNDRIHAEIKAD